MQSIHSIKMNEIVLFAVFSNISELVKGVQLANIGRHFHWV